MPLMASVTVASLAATNGGIAAIKSSTPTAPIIAFVFMSTTSGTDYTAHRGEHRLVRDTESRFTFDPGGEITPLWSPDGRRGLQCVIHVYARSAPCG